MEACSYLTKLSQREIKPTALRLLILKAMMQFEQAFSLLDLETYLDTVDKSTLSRTITLFLKHHLIHSIDDGSGSLKYAVCGNECNCDIDDLHVHFYCTSCQRTLCLKGIHIPAVTLPRHFSLESINYVMKGLCDHCSKG
ncbi:transcriptional repressor [Bacteroides sp.]|uniref:Fur family transcriptional regulator n=1 Tax=Bacteroides sp. TaxID=29523 RepID=UPI001B41228B|nr:transcriptional repressor [Bacteroides sp.]MBP6064564.1 transcriptional repressor [Bacteroides sp.]MBP6066725.1 transcriptional repressor [Bacteroides sp.]MBP6935439.1 transcriptional repressor [Bacteroides sp.]MBP8622103.1 transcriptional repressor [Bacteroides sp.]MBP9506714.1 transcriptional repressor [Bacteroides sp.]